MIVFQITIIILFAAIVGTALARRFHLPLELTLLVGSLVVAMIPGIPEVNIDSHLVFFVLLPPILFAAAYFTSWSDFKRNIRPISLLAFGLVVFTVVGMAVVIKWLVPNLTWSIAFLFGAIISPPDASAAATVIRKVGLPRRLHTILEGESLINDATALVCYRFALAALISGEFSFGESVAEFALVAVGGVAVGLVIAYLTLRLLLLINDTSAEALLTLVAAFACYFVAESLHLSGVISTVAGGLYSGRMLPRCASPETRVEAKALWNVALLTVNVLIFTMIGLQLPSILKGFSGSQLLQLCSWAIVLTFALVLIRFVWVYPAAWLPRALVPGLAKRDPMPAAGELVILAWTGMRGIVSLAAALALPSMVDGRVFEERSLIIFLAYAVILLTLFIPTITLAPLLRFLNLQDGYERQDDEVRARIAMSRAAKDYIAELRAKGDHDEALLSDLENKYGQQISRLAPNLETFASSALHPSEQNRRALLVKLLEHERSVLHQLRSRGELYDEVYHQLADELDLEALRIRRNMRPI